MRLFFLILVLLSATTAWAQDAGTDAGSNPFEADMGQCESDSDCEEGYACGNGQCEFFDAVGDMGLGGGGGGGDTGDGAEGSGDDTTDDGGGCSTAGSVGASPLLLLVGLLGLSRRR